MINNIIKIELDVEDYIDLLDQRRNLVEEHYNWHIPDCLWDYFCELIRECGISNDNRPDVVVDNVIINGDWGYFDDYKSKDETDDDFVLRNEDRALYLNQEERIVCFSL